MQLFLYTLKVSQGLFIYNTHIPQINETLFIKDKIVKDLRPEQTIPQNVVWRS